MKSDRIKTKKYTLKTSKTNVFTNFQTGPSALSNFNAGYTL